MHYLSIFNSAPFRLLLWKLNTRGSVTCKEWAQFKRSVLRKRSWMGNLFSPRVLTSSLKQKHIMGLFPGKKKKEAKTAFRFGVCAHQECRRICFIYPHKAQLVVCGWNGRISTTSQVNGAQSLRGEERHERAGSENQKNVTDQRRSWSVCPTPSYQNTVCRQLWTESLRALRCRSELPLPLPPPIPSLRSFSTFHSLSPRSSDWLIRWVWVVSACVTSALPEDTDFRHCSRSGQVLWNLAYYAHAHAHTDILLLIGCFISWNHLFFFPWNTFLRNSFLDYSKEGFWECTVQCGPAHSGLIPDM